MNRKSIYCFGSKMFKEILAKLIAENICEFPIIYLNHTDDPNSVWGYQAYTNSGKSIGYSEDPKWFDDAGYFLVSPEEFYKIWSGKDWNCKEPVKSEKKYIGFIGSSDVNISLLPENIKNPNNFSGHYANLVYYIKNNVFCVINKVVEKRLLEKIDVFDWADFLAIVTVSTHEVPFVSEQIKASIPPGLCIPQPSILETESSNCDKLTLSKKQTLKIVL